MPSALWNVPNLLSLSRLPLAVAMFLCISWEQWFASLVIFVVATVTDWLDGWWARRFGSLSAVGRSLDPLTDKVIVCGAFVFLLPVPKSELQAWMVTVIVGRELIVTGLRGIVEAGGKSFGADWFGKLKMVLQCAAIISILVLQVLWDREEWHALARQLRPVHFAILYAMLLATVGSLLQYLLRAIKLLS